MSIPLKRQWIERAKYTFRFHCSKIKENNGNWKLEATARELKRSIGSVSEDIIVASWLKTHQEDLEQFKYLKDALAFIRKKKDKMRFDDSFLSD